MHSDITASNDDDFTSKVGELFGVETSHFCECVWVCIDIIVGLLSRYVWRGS